MIRKIADYAPEDVEAGVGLAIQDENGRYLFFLAGTRHRCPPGELFYAGIGGHRETGEKWLDCAHREALEEVGVDIIILSSSVTWFIPQQGQVQNLEILDKPQPLAFYEMIHPPDTPRAGQIYRLVIYRARLLGRPTHLPEVEVQGVIALTAEQVIQGPGRRSTLADLVEEGGEIVAGGKMIPPQTTCLYPIGTALALAHILRLEE